MRTPLTSRQCAEKDFYVFFTMSGKYSKSYAVVKARSLEKARYAAYELYGFENVGSVIACKEHAESKARAFGLNII